MSVYNGYNWSGLYQGIKAIGDTQNRFLAAEESNLDRQTQQQNLDRNYELAKAKATQGQQPPWYVQPDGSVHPAMLQVKQAGRPQTNVNVNAGTQQETAYDKELGGSLAKEFMKYQAESASANRSIQDLTLMEKAISDPNLYTGTMGESARRLKRTAATLFGVDVKGLDSAAVVNSVSKKIALSYRKELPGPLSNDDRKFLVSIAPGLHLSKEGNLAVIRVGMAQRQYEVDVARAANEYVRKNGRLDKGWYAAKAELDQKYAGVFGGLMEQVRAAVQGVQQPGPGAGMPDALLNSRAWQSLPVGKTVYGPDGTPYTKR